MSRALPSRRRRVLAAATGAAAVVAALIALVATSAGGAPSTTAVGTVTSLNTPGKLLVKPGGEGTPQELQAGQVLYLGDVVVPIDGVDATLDLDEPPGVGNADLVEIDPPKGPKINLTLDGTGPTIIVTIRG